MGQTIAVQEKKLTRLETLQDLLKKYEGHMAELLPRHFDPKRMLRIAIVTLGRNPALGECTPASVLGCVLESVRQGFEPGAGPGHTWLIPFRNKYKNGIREAQLIVDYRAIIKIIRRNKDVGPVMSELVCENDSFGYGVGSHGPYLEWKPSKDRGRPIGFFSGAWDRQGRLYGHVYKTIEEINKKHRARSKAGKGGPWDTDYDEMAKKTVIRPLGKLLPDDDQGLLQRAIALDEKAELGKPQDLAILADPTIQVTPDEPKEKDVPDPKPAKAKDGNGKSVPKKEDASPHDAEGIIDRVTMTEIEGKAGHYVYLKGGERYIAWEKKVAQLAKDRKGKKVKIAFDATNVGREIQLLEPA